MASSPGDRVLNPHGRRHYRRSYSLAEVRAGMAVLALLACVLGWVVWMGPHPDPALFANADLLDPGEAVVERGVLPEALAPEGFVEGPISHFEEDNLYEKINGRAGYFTSKGFVRLSFVSLRSERDEATAIDVELYDLGSADNALGAYSGEKDAAIEPEPAAAGLMHRDRNALYLTHGPYYVRAIGSSESDAVVGALAQLAEALQRGLPASEAKLPWAHGVFAQLDIGSGRVTYHRENAFSFGFARGVYAALLPDDETELFVVAAADGAAATALAARFVEGFGSYGEALAGDDAGWVKDRYLGAFASARTVGPLVCGVRGAPELAAAREKLAALCAVLGGLEASVLGEALAGAAAGPEKGAVVAAEADGERQGAGDGEPAYPRAQQEAEAPVEEGYD